MPAADTPPPDEDRIFELLRKTGLTPEEAFTLFAGIRDMASANLIAARSIFRGYSRLSPPSAEAVSGFPAPVFSRIRPKIAVFSV